MLYNLLWIYNPTSIVVDSCSRRYGALIAVRLESFMDERRNEAIPIGAEIRQARYDEYHQMRGCFHMARDSWIRQVAGAVSDGTA